MEATKTAQGPCLAQPPTASSLGRVVQSCQAEPLVNSVCPYNLRNEAHRSKHQPAPQHNCLQTGLLQHVLTTAPPASWLLSQSAHAPAEPPSQWLQVIRVLHMHALSRAARDLRRLRIVANIDQFHAQITKLLAYVFIFVHWNACLQYGSCTAQGARRQAASCVVSSSCGLCCYA